MKKVILSLAIAAIAFTANAQKESDKTLKFSAGIEAGLPMGDFKTSTSFGVGGSLQGEYVAAENIGITLSAGFLAFGGKSYDFLGTSVKGPSWSVIPVLAGAKYSFTEKVYAHAQVGMSFLNNGGGSGFTYAPAIGFLPTENIDISVKYFGAAVKGGGTLSFIGLRAAYTF